MGIMGERIRRKLRRCTWRLRRPPRRARRCSWPAARSGRTTSPTKTETALPAGWDGTTVAAPAQTSVATTEAAAAQRMVERPQRSEADPTGDRRAQGEPGPAHGRIGAAAGAGGARRDRVGLLADRERHRLLQRSGTARRRPRPRDLFQAGLDAAWELDFFGGVRRNIESADASIHAAVENRTRRADQRGRGGGDRLRGPARLPAAHPDRPGQSQGAAAHRRADPPEIQGRARQRRSTWPMRTRWWPPPRRRFRRWRPASGRPSTR